jgi:IclR family pca regulon transcriptional regulator
MLGYRCSKAARSEPSRVLLASEYLASNQFITVMHPLIDEVATKAEVCSLAIPDRNDVVFVARANPARVFSTDLDIGYWLPAFCTSVGRVLLGHLSDDILRDTIDAVPISP